MVFVISTLKVRPENNYSGDKLINLPIHFLQETALAMEEFSRRMNEEAAELFAIMDRIEMRMLNSPPQDVSALLPIT